MGLIGAIKTWAAEEVLTHTDLNATFSEFKTKINSYAVFKDLAATITANHTYTPTAGVGITVTTGGVAVTGNSTITGTLGGLTGLTVASGGMTVTGNSTIIGTLGGLTGLTVASGGVTVTAGGLTITAGGATVAAGGVTVTTGNVVAAAGQIVSTRVAKGASGTALTLDWNDGNVQHVTLTGNCTLAFANPQAGARYTVRLTQDGTGSRLVTWPASVKWPSNAAPTLTTGINQTDIVDFLYNGTTYEGVVVGLDYSP